MNGRLYLTLALILALALTGATHAAGGPSKKEYASAGINSPAQLTSFIKTLQEAIKKSDKSAVAATVDFPLTEVNLNGKERSIENKDEFIANYDAIMTEEVKDAVLKVKMKDIYVNDKRVMLPGVGDDGRVRFWLIGAGENVRIVKILSD